MAPVNSMVVGLLPHDPPDTVARMARSLLVSPFDRILTFYLSRVDGTWPLYSPVKGLSEKVPLFHTRSHVVVLTTTSLTGPEARVRD